MVEKLEEAGNHLATACLAFTRLSFPAKVRRPGAKKGSDPLRSRGRTPSSHATARLPAHFSPTEGTPHGSRHARFRMACDFDAGVCWLLGQADPAGAGSGCPGKSLPERT